VTYPNNEAKFNGLIDLETSMPILAIPIKCESKGKILGAFEVINTRGLEGMTTTGTSKLTNKDYEILDFFSKQLAQCILNQEDIEFECDLGILNEKKPGPGKSGKEDFGMKLKNDHAQSVEYKRDEAGVLRTQVGMKIRHIDSFPEKDPGGNDTFPETANEILKKAYHKRFVSHHFCTTVSSDDVSKRDNSLRSIDKYTKYRPKSVDYHLRHCTSKKTIKSYNKGISVVGIKEFSSGFKKKTLISGFDMDDNTRRMLDMESG
jgi:hypothetical protein